MDHIETLDVDGTDYTLSEPRTEFGVTVRDVTGTAPSVTGDEATFNLKDADGVAYFSDSTVVLAEAGLYEWDSDLPGYQRILDGTAQSGKVNRNLQNINEDLTAAQIATVREKLKVDENIEGHETYRTLFPGYTDAVQAASGGYVLFSAFRSYNGEPYVRLADIEWYDPDAGAALTYTTAQSELRSNRFGRLDLNELSHMAQDVRIANSNFTGEMTIRLLRLKAQQWGGIEGANDFELGTTTGEILIARIPENINTVEWAAVEPHGEPILRFEGETDSLTWDVTHPDRWLITYAGRVSNATGYVQTGDGGSSAIFPSLILSNNSVRALAGSWNYSETDDGFEYQTLGLAHFYESTTLRYQVWSRQGYDTSVPAAEDWADTILLTVEDGEVGDIIYINEPDDIASDDDYFSNHIGYPYGELIAGRFQRYIELSQNESRVATVRYAIAEDAATTHGIAHRWQGHFYQARRDLEIGKITMRVHPQDATEYRLYLFKMTREDTEDYRITGSTTLISSMNATANAEQDLTWELSTAYSVSTDEYVWIGLRCGQSAARLVRLDDAIDTVSEAVNLLDFVGWSAFDDGTTEHSVPADTNLWHTNADDARFYTEMEIDATVTEPFSVERDGVVELASYFHTLNLEGDGITVTRDGNKANIEVSGDPVTSVDLTMTADGELTLTLGRDFGSDITDTLVIRTFRGAFSSTRTYQAGDVVQSGGHFWVSALANNTGNTPSVTGFHWAQLTGATIYRTAGSTAADYGEGSLVLANDILYYCTADVTSINADGIETSDDFQRLTTPPQPTDTEIESGIGDDLRSWSLSDVREFVIEHTGQTSGGDHSDPNFRLLNTRRVEKFTGRHGAARGICVWDEVPYVINEDCYANEEVIDADIDPVAGGVRNENHWILCTDSAIRVYEYDSTNLEWDRLTLSGATGLTGLRGVAMDGEGSGSVFVVLQVDSNRIRLRFYGINGSGTTSSQDTIAITTTDLVSDTGLSSGVVLDYLQTLAFHDNILYLYWRGHETTTADYAQTLELAYEITGSSGSREADLLTGRDHTIDIVDDLIGAVRLDRDMYLARTYLIYTYESSNTHHTFDEAALEDSDSELVIGRDTGKDIRFEGAGVSFSEDDDEITALISGLYRGAWGSSNTYQTGHIVLNDSRFWISTEDENQSNTPAVDADEWIELTTAMQYTASAPSDSTAYAAGNVVGTNSELYLCITDVSEVATNIPSSSDFVRISSSVDYLASAPVASTAYITGTIVRTGGELYVCTTNVSVTRANLPGSS